MERFASRSISSDFRIYVRSAGTGVLVFFEYKHPRAFGYNEAIAILRKGPRPSLGIVVPGRRHDLHQAEAFHDPRRQRNIDPSGEQHRQSSELDLPKGVAKRVCRRSTAGREYMAEAAEAEAHTHFAGQCSHGAARDAEQ